MRVASQAAQYAVCIPLSTCIVEADHLEIEVADVVVVTHALCGTHRTGYSYHSTRFLSRRFTGNEFS